jgi:hypothetical protein
MEIQEIVRDMFDKEGKDYLNEKGKEELEEIKRILREMRKSLSKYEDKYMDEYEYMIYDMGEYRIDEDIWWIYEYEIDVYEENVDERLKKYELKKNIMTIL